MRYQEIGGENKYNIHNRESIDVVIDANETNVVIGLKFDSIVHVIVVGTIESTRRTIVIVTSLKTVSYGIYVTLVDHLAIDNEDAIELHGICGATISDSTNTRCPSID